MSRTEKEKGEERNGLGVEGRRWGGAGWDAGKLQCWAYGKMRKGIAKYILEALMEKGMCYW